jgi:hypothetical protein
VESLGPWIFATAVFLVLSYLLISIPRARRIVGYSVLALVAIAAAAWGLIMVMEQRSNDEYRREQELSKSLIKKNDLSLSNMQLSLSGATGELTGIVRNNSGFVLKDIRISARIWNCKPSELLKDCSVVGQDDGLDFGVNVPPAQARGINVFLNFDNLPADLKEWTWSYEVTETAATSQ